MNRNWIRFFRFRLLAIVLFFLLLSIFSIDRLVFAEEVPVSNNETLQITTLWPNKTALQIEENITKPWEQILKSVSGYKKIESISEVGSSLIHLELEGGFEKQSLIQTIRNEYLLQRQRFPEDSLFPKIKLGKLEGDYIIILQKIKEGPEKNRKELEQKIRNISGLESLIHYSHKETEMVVQVHSNWIHAKDSPSLSEIFTTIRNYHWGFGFDPLNHIWFQKDFPILPESFSKLEIPFRLGEGLKFSTLGKVTLEERELRHGTRINGLSSETMILKAENNIALYGLTSELKTLLNKYNDWILLYSSHQDLMNDWFRFFIIFFSVDFLLVIFASYLGLEGTKLPIYFCAYYTSLLVFLGICVLLVIPIGKVFLFLFILWKYLFAIFSLKRLGPWAKQSIYSFFIFILFIYLDWIPKIFGFILLSNVFFFIFISFLKILYNPFIRIHCPKFPLFVLDLNISFFRKYWKGSNAPRSLFQIFLVSIFLFIGFVFAIHSSVSLHPLRIPDGSIQMAKLEFPTSIPEQESLRITKQVEDTLLKRQITDLLVVKQNPSNADFYYRLNENGLEKGLNDLPTESGYFHTLSASEVSAGYIIRFSNADTQVLENYILPLVPWLRNFDGISEVVLCFQPSVEGLELMAPAMFRNLLRYGVADAVRERSLDLQSAIVGRMLINERLTDIRFTVEQSKDLDRYKEKGIKLPTGITLFDKSFSRYHEIKTPGRIYHKNGDTSLELLIKGNNIQWDELKSRINQLLSIGPVRLTEILPQKNSEMNYRPIFLFLWIFVFLFRKKSKIHWFLMINLFLLLWKMQTSLFSDEYLLFGTLSIALAVFLFWTKDFLFRLGKIIPLIFLVLISYLFPGEGGKFFFEGLSLLLIFFVIQDKIFIIGRFFKTNTSF
ncbi:efflux RND transporter permease subunit [Leptospira sp. 2 VSF19]|uniref:Efflux RND transporter permease subunit n=1 Tax=Leptospira soteropolitanensis TaxID=2950025 RepID=A0AAW5VMV1_9LEPT|nr:efflux RND transporter permease subunit [Leptospira soteropolitanensis]MCW7493881.1 efflux RND transporter permease subunit [Leptospira soteropolitanensis]MCW7501475.1 efflux RND transporter permease subunit [Leptospira soteropolitanensis]MCW7523762.1 efflux RND transporter permease subunit [Leptospira soteropolitanensis]MCW7527626.1 efflux RND transporter permease subunit [Leptospira soteropolitanensis]MCW7531480.1 efflux RND transporter permease subunit [Leptospira soteropolitanensis]